MALSDKCHEVRSTEWPFIAKSHCLFQGLSYLFFVHVEFYCNIKW